MRWKIPGLFLVVLLFTAASVAYAQDPAKADPNHCKVQFENAQVRVLHWTTGPHEKTPMHEHPAYVSIFLTDNDVRYTLPDPAFFSQLPYVLSGILGGT
jgi:hypothetical protein